MRKVKFKDVLFQICDKIGLQEKAFNMGSLLSKSPVLLRVPDKFSVKNYLKRYFRQHGITLIYVDCLSETPQVIRESLVRAGYNKPVSLHDIDRAKTVSQNDNVLLIDHYSDLNDVLMKMFVEGTLELSKINGICGLKQIPVILTFNKKDGMNYLYRSNYNIFDERCWK